MNKDCLTLKSNIMITLEKLANELNFNNIDVVLTAGGTTTVNGKPQSSGGTGELTWTTTTDSRGNTRMSLIWQA